MTLTDTTRRKIVIVGGGIGGMGVLTRVFRYLRHPNVWLLEPSAKHDYAPLWPFLGVGLAKPEEARRPRADLLPEGSKWMREEATKIELNDRVITTASKMSIDYEYLVLSPGLERSYGKIKGIDEGLEGGSVCSIYGHEEALASRAVLERFAGGTILFAQPQGAPNDGLAWQYLLLVDDALRKRGLRDKSKLIYVTAETELHTHEPVKTLLERLAQARDIEIKRSLSLTKVRHEEREAEFGQVNEKGKVTKEIETLSYDLLHLTPLMTPPAVVAKNRKIAVSRGEQKGMLSVDPETLQNTSYPTVFGLGSVIGSQTPASMGAVRKQAPIVAHNVVAALQGKGPKTFLRYDGYTSFPLTTQAGKTQLIEWNYKAPTRTVPFASDQENALLWWLTRYVMPRFYWRSI